MLAKAVTTEGDDARAGAHVGEGVVVAQHGADARQDARQADAWHHEQLHQEEHHGGQDEEADDEDVHLGVMING